MEGKAQTRVTGLNDRSESFLSVPLRYSARLRASGGFAAK
jgi:hypothetical protein